MSRRFAKVSEEEIVAINEAALEQLQNTGPLLKIYIREWLAGSAVVLVL